MSKDKKKEHLSNEELISLYSIFHDLQKGCTDSIFRHMTLYINSNLLVLGGGIAILGTMKSSPFKYISLVMCGILVVVLSITLMKSARRVFLNQMEYVAQTGQIEDMLKFNDKKKYASHDYFKNEGLMVKRHIKNRKESINKKGKSTKKAFVKKFIYNGQMKYIVAIAWTFIVFGAILALYPLISMIFDLGI